MVVPTDEELAKLKDQFVCVRLIQMGGVDLATFQFDPHLSWSLFFMNGDKTIYGRYGRAHPDSKRAKKDSNTNLNVPGMKSALAKALEVHGNYTADKETWAPRLAGKTGPEPAWRFAEKTPSAKKYKRQKRVEKEGEHGCVHCHEVHRHNVDSHFMTKKEVPDDLLWLYPRPHVLGLTMVESECARVEAVSEGSPAAAAGIAVGDDIVSLGGQPLVSIADLQWVLHTFPDEGGKLAAELQRGEKTVKVEIPLAPMWRRTEDFAWRYRTFGYAQWLWAGVSFEDSAGGVRVAARAPSWFKRVHRRAKREFEVGDVIIDVDGRGDFDRSGLIAYLMRDKKLGSRVKINVLRDGKKEKVQFDLPKKQPEVMGY